MDNAYVLGSLNNLQLRAKMHADFDIYNMTPVQVLFICLIFTS